MTLSRWTVALLSLSAVSFSALSSARADEDLSVAFDAGVLSNYIYRGISRSDGKAAFQGSVDLSHDNGFYGRFFASSIDNALGQDVEGEAAFGYGTRLGAYDVDVSLAYDSFWGGTKNTDYWELRSAISRDMGFAFFRTGANMAFAEQWFKADGSSFYGYGEAEFPIPIKDFLPLSLNVRSGYEIFNDRVNKWDWRVMLATEYKGLVFALAYHDTKRDTFISGKSYFTASVRYLF